MAEQQDYLRGEFKRVSPLRPRRARVVEDVPAIVPAATEAPAAAPAVEAPVPEIAPAVEAPAVEAPAVKAPAAVAPPAGTREHRLDQLLDEFLATSTDTQAAAVVSLDGFIMAAALPDDLEEDRVAAMSAAILALGERASGELGRGKLNQVFIEGEQGYVLLMSSGPRAALVAMASTNAKLGLIFYDMRRVASEIAATLAAT